MSTRKHAIRTYAWPDPGHYLARLTVTDTYGAELVHEWDVNVTPHATLIASDDVVPDGSGNATLRATLVDASVATTLAVGRTLEFDLGGVTSSAITDATGAAATAATGLTEPTPLRVSFAGDTHFLPSEENRVVPDVEVAEPKSNCGRDFWFTFGHNRDASEAVRHTWLTFAAERGTAVRITGAAQGSLYVAGGVPGVF